MNRIDRVTQDTLEMLESRDKHIDIQLSAAKASAISEVLTSLKQDDVAFVRALHVAKRLNDAGYGVTVHAPKDGACRISVESKHIVN